MDKDKVQGIAALQPPKTLKELRAFLGMVGYYRRFIRDFSARTSQLTELLKKDFSFEWGEACQKEFIDLKQALTNDPVLALPNEEGRFRLYTDFSSIAVSAIL
jgi:hypothetical protein